MFTPSFLQISPAWLVSLIVFVLIGSSYVVGHRLQSKKSKIDPQFAERDSGKISGILIGLLGFLLAFTFGMSNARFDKRRDLTVQEANNIGTAFLRTKAYPDSVQKILT